MYPALLLHRAVAGTLSRRGETADRVFKILVHARVQAHVCTHSLEARVHFVLKEGTSSFKEVRGMGLRRGSNKQRREY